MTMWMRLFAATAVLLAFGPSGLGADEGPSSLTLGQCIEMDLPAVGLHRRTHGGQRRRPFLTA